MNALKQQAGCIVLPQASLKAVVPGLLTVGLLVSFLSLEAFANAAEPIHPRDDMTAIAEAEAVRIVLSLSDRRVYLYKGKTVADSYPVAVGAAATPTPQGEFEVSKLVIEPVWQSPWTGEMHAPGPDSALGLRWIGFFADESGAFGFHGTPTLDSIGKAVSNGCVRMRNEDIVALFSQVSIGTPVVVMP